jgi:hypothetical protein
VRFKALQAFLRRASRKTDLVGKTDQRRPGILSQKRYKLGINLVEALGHDFYPVAFRISGCSGVRQSQAQPLSMP